MTHKRCLHLFIVNVLAERLTAKIHRQQITLGMYVQCLFKTAIELHSFLKEKEKYTTGVRKRFLLNEGCTSKL